MALLLPVPGTRLSHRIGGACGGGGERSTDHLPICVDTERGERQFIESLDFWPSARYRPPASTNSLLGSFAMFGEWGLPAAKPWAAQTREHVSCVFYLRPNWSIQRGIRHHHLSFNVEWQHSSGEFENVTDSNRRNADSCTRLLTDDNGSDAVVQVRGKRSLSMCNLNG